NGLGIAVQAYSKRAIPMLRWLRKLALSHGKRIPLRLVKGAYWDSEIKWAQELGLADYAVLTRKLHTDVSYLACMRFLFSDVSAFYPQIATHNAHSVAAAMTAAGNTDFEYQRLHGMGEALFEDVLGADGLGRPCRIYAPVGEHDVLLSYLVRRLLENGANTSFVNRLSDLDSPISHIVMDPVERLEKERHEQTPVKSLVRPRDVFWPDRKNSKGLSFATARTRTHVVSEMEAAIDSEFEVGPIVAGEAHTGGNAATWMLCPHNRGQRLGSTRSATPDDVEMALATATAAAWDWDRRGGTERGKILQLAADIFERDHTQLMAVLVRESGKTIASALAEVRQTVDSLRYYAAEARQVFVDPQTLRSTTGEVNTTRLRGRGVFACISPWSSPLAGFTSQVAAALAAGNSVIAKPAPQTPLAAYLAIKILHEAGVPSEVLHVLTGGSVVGAALTKDPRIAGVAFTGSTANAWDIQKTLADRRGAIQPFIAATGGINAMISDSSALAEHLVRDVVQSAFQNAGQNCASARVLFLQDDTADRVIEMLVGAVNELTIGDPMAFTTDIGPVIDGDAQDRLDAHKLNMKHQGRELVDLALPAGLRFGSYVAPSIYEVQTMEALTQEVFGPVLHIVRFERGYLDRVVGQINQCGFGLTLSVHSRISAVGEYVEDQARVGNLYLNRQQISAVPGVQPFGGMGLSGSGPQAGGPNYLLRFAQEQTRTDNITATGGNIRLLAHDLSDPD
ncbi:MAG: bifunctional proline dehydrogenase/L-glutamate gamma-semialdehyde dehydrogenase PutA, partial [Alphaproteobacteria bacterium]|nr:bifunctional proline dehydrogenase/L-glutamate gamma-semialdehyde dehydrogenase PutA [Alphaproteobacteria bacterium]